MVPATKRKKPAADYEGANYRVVTLMDYKRCLLQKCYSMWNIEGACYRVATLCGILKVPATKLLLYAEY